MEVSAPLLLQGLWDVLTLSGQFWGRGLATLSPPAHSMLTWHWASWPGAWLTQTCAQGQRAGCSLGQRWNRSFSCLVGTSITSCHLSRTVASLYAHGHKIIMLFSLAANRQAGQHGGEKGRPQDGL